MDTKFLLSVRLMTYNHEAFIEDALTGIEIQQTNFPFEVIVGDDFSEDGTLDRIKNYKFSNPKIEIKILNRKIGDEYYLTRKKKGRLYNFINILNNCSGKYIALLDGDDYWRDPLKLQKQVDFLEKNNTFSLSFHDAEKTDEDGKSTGKFILKNELKKDLHGDQLKSGPHILLNTVCFRNVIKIYPQEFFNVPNGDKFLISLLGNFGGGKFHPDIQSSAYRQHPGGVWSSKKLIQKEIMELNTCQTLASYYLKINDLKTSKHFQKRWKKKFNYFMGNKFPLSDELKIIKLLIRNKNYLSSYWYGLYKMFYNLSKRGYIFRRKFVDSLKQNLDDY